MPTRMLRIQYASNLLVHTRPVLESIKLLRPSAPVLALLGNIGHPYCDKTRDFFRWTETKYQHIFWIPGALEYSSSTENATSWYERSDQIYESIRNWELNRTLFCQKLEFKYPGTNINILATSLGFPIEYLNQHYTWNSLGNYSKMTRADMQFFISDELNWIRRRVNKVNAPTLMLSNQYVPKGFSTSTQPHCNIHGTWGKTPASYTGGDNPWWAMNMAGHAGYLPDAYVSWDTICRKNIAIDTTKKPSSS
jgi:hypothetical protein